jgi:hypothetical protein
MMRYKLTLHSGATVFADGEIHEIHPWFPGGCPAVEVRGIVYRLAEGAAPEPVPDWDEVVRKAEALAETFTDATEKIRFVCARSGFSLDDVLGYWSTK